MLEYCCILSERICLGDNIIFVYNGEASSAGGKGGGGRVLWPTDRASAGRNVVKSQCS